MPRKRTKLTGQRGAVMLENYRQLVQRARRYDDRNDEG